MKLKGRTALVTGAAQGIGRAIALAMAREGANVGVADLDLEGAKVTARDAEQLGAVAVALPVDIADSASVERMFRECTGRLGQVDILVNNAGIMANSRGFDVSEENWDRVMGVNLKGAFLCSRVAVPYMTERGWGRVINISSTAGLNGSPSGDIPYSASKAGIVGLTKTMAHLVAARGVTVNAIAPGPTDTEITAKFGSRTREEWAVEGGRRVPIGRLGSPDEIAAAALFLASDDASFITGTTMSVSGGALMH